MDDKWRTLSCPICRGYGMTMVGDGLPNECDCSSGQIWLRPKGHAFQYPGGPGSGMWGPEYYEKATPVMPWEWHWWKEGEKEVEAMVLDRWGDLDKDANTVHCECGFVGTIREHDGHVKDEEAKFLAKMDPNRYQYPPVVATTGSAPLSWGMLVGTFSTTTNTCQ